MTNAIKYTTAGYGEGPEKDLIEDPKIAEEAQLSLLKNIELDSKYLYLRTM